MPVPVDEYRGVVFKIDERPKQFRETPILKLYKELAELVPKREGKLVELRSSSQGNSLAVRLATLGVDGIDGIAGGAKFDVYHEKQSGSQNRYIWMRPKGEEAE
jgi:hypothetical protein